MSAPKFVPTTDGSASVYSSPPLRSDIGETERPGEQVGSVSTGKRLGSAGPDQGYAYKLAEHFSDRLNTGSVSHEDAVEGCIAVAMKRAALFGRAPVIHDLTCAFSIFGFLTSSVSDQLVEKRETLFDEVANHHHYAELRELVDSVSDTFLAKSQSEIEAECAKDWRAPFVD